MEIDQLHQIFLQSQGVATDTRSIKTNQLFFALKGDNFNGNTFAWQALKKGAGYAVVDEKEYAKGEKYILVENVLKTLQNLATHHRNYLGLPILAITGSNGKTTSKELINAVLKKKFNTVATQGNLNNHIGVPLTLLSFKEKTEFGIVEMGANHPLEIKRLCEIAQPDYGYITNFGKAHLEGFGGIEGVIKAKGELYEHLKARQKTIFLNADDPLQRKHMEYQDTFTFGQADDADVKVSYIPSVENAQVFHNGVIFNSKLTGSFNAINMAAAISIGTYFKVSNENTKKAIENYLPQNNRSQIIKIKDTTFLMDAYNANPTSMLAALQSFQSYPSAKKIVILGDMFELGQDAEKEHQGIVEYLEKKSDFSKVYLTGSNFAKTVSSVKNIQKFESFDDLKKELQNEDFSHNTILVKGSRGMALERLLDIFKEVSKSTSKDS